MRRVLMVAYIFPPTATTGVHRTAKFAQYLPDFGWQPVVLTTGNCAYPQLDESLSVDLPTHLKTIKVQAFESAHAQQLARRILQKVGLTSRFGEATDWRINELYKNKNVPDEHAPWANRAIRTALDILRHMSIDVIYTTSWPYSDHLVGLEAARVTKLPWVADFRDPWLGNSAYRRHPELGQGAKDREIERRIVETASAVIGTSSRMVEDFRSRYSDINPNRFHLVRNGYEPGSIPNHSQIENQGLLKIGYVGAFYRSRSPKTILEALSVLKQHGVSPRELQFVFVGNMGGTDKVIDKLNLAEYCQVLGQRPAVDCYDAVSDCAVLWQLNPNEDALVVPGKTYEYIATDKWILALMPRDLESAELMADAGPGVTFVNPDDLESIVSVLWELLDKHKKGELRPKRNARYVEQFSRRSQTSLLADVFNNLVESSA